MAVFGVRAKMPTMMSEKDLAGVLARLETRLDQIEMKLDNIRISNRKSLEWIGMLSEHIRSLDEFREEVRASFEPMIGKLDNIDEVTRILRHATVDLSRRVEHVERAPKDGECLIA